ncbi:hypothetical protein PCANC_16478 [Puccinia coronata f. sp. avenae]|uniref:Uncharacterized protein n=1 Tax=Puccinia coronata f. sp. avenae TaxID=200324 RepID=A0A2N5SRV0_9BASI|nr:hypothetical protein PCANC_16478 [Puccinia coronata f. sp. avenae]
MAKTKKNRKLSAQTEERTDKEQQSLSSGSSSAPSSLTLIDRANKSYPASITSLPTSQNGSFSYHHHPNQSHSNQQPFLHRCRFTDFTPATITALACSPPTWDAAHHLISPSVLQPDHPTNSHRGLLAVGRGNGDIELWIWLDDHHQASQKLAPTSHYQRKKINPSSSSHQAWTLYRTLPGHLPSISTHTTNSSHPTKQPPPSSSKVEHLLFTHQFVPSSDLDPNNAPQIDHDEIKSLARTLPRLLGSNGADQVLEWEWDGPKAGTIKRTLSMPPSVAIWSLSASPGSTRLAIGCDDGTIRIANIADEQLELIRKFDPCKTRLLSLAWGISSSSSSSPEQPQSSTTTNNHYPIEPPDSNLFLVAGCADSSLRKWALSSGRCVNRMTVEKLQGEQTLVWTVAVVNGTIISGDSIGNVHFWDAKSCSRRQTIRAHRADVLCIVASPDGQSIFTSGVDQKTCQMTLNVQTLKTGVISQSRWLLSASRRLHSHDVRALEMSPPYNPLFSNSSTTHSPISFTAQNIHAMVPVLISGGLDMSLVLCPAGPPASSMVTGSVNFNHLPNPVSDSFSVSFADSMQRKISYATRRDPVAHLSPHAHLLVCRNSQQISIWRLRSTSSDPDSLLSVVQKKSPNPQDGDAAWAKVVEMDLKCRTNLITSAISPDGRWLAVSDLYEVKLFYLNKLEDGAVIQPRRVKGFRAFESLKCPKGRAQGAHCIEFSADSTRLVMAGSLTSDLVVMDLGCLDGTPSIKILRVFYHRASRVDQAHPLRPIITPPSLANTTSLDTPSSSSSSSSPPDESADEGNQLEDELEDRQSYVVKMAISPDGQWLATADSKRTLHIFNLDAMKHHCYLPLPGSVVNTIAFPPAMPSVVVVGFANNVLHVMDVETRQVPLWATEVCTNTPEGLRQMRDSMLGMVFAPMQQVDERGSAGASRTESPVAFAGLPPPLPPSLSSKNASASAKPIVGLIWGANWLAKIRLLLPPPTDPLHLSRHQLPLPKLKRRRTDDRGGAFPSPKVAKAGGQDQPRTGHPPEPSEPTDEAPTTITTAGTTTTGKEGASEDPTRARNGAHGYSIESVTVQVSHKYQSLLLADFLSPHEIVLVERPFFSLLLNHLPPVWQRAAAYGT